MDAPEIRYTTTKDGVRVAYGFYGGTAPPLVIAAWPGGCPMPMRYRIPGVAAQTTALTERYAVYEFDHRGTGYSSEPITSLSMDDWVADLEAVVEAIGPPVDIFGGSAGCFPVVHLAAARPSLFRRIVLANPAVAWRRGFVYHAFDGHAPGTAASAAVPRSDDPGGVRPRRH